MDTHAGLINDHLDQELTNVGFGELSTWLREDDRHLHEFAVAWLIHSLLHDMICQRQIHADALIQTMTTNGAYSQLSINQSSDKTIGASAYFSIRGHGSRAPADRGLRRWHSRLIGLAVLLIVAATCGVIAYFATRPTVIAMVTQTANCRWGRNNGDLAEGALIKSGDELRLVDGHALITFVSGARVVMEGPAVMKFESGSTATLTAGAATVTVPSHAIGFAINTPLARLVDLGTEFTARIRRDGRLELQVFEGMVELSVADRFNRTDDSPWYFSEGVAVTVNAISGEVKELKYDAGEKIELR